MEAFRQQRVLCRTTLAPSIAKAQNERTLGAFHAPARGSEREADAADGKRQRSGLVKAQQPTLIIFNPVQHVHKLVSETLTDQEAEQIVYPYHSTSITTPFEQVLVALIDKLTSTVSAVTWNQPVEHGEWKTDLRFFGSWWLVIRSGKATTASAAPTTSTTGATDDSQDSRSSGRRRGVSWVQGMYGEPLVASSMTALLRSFHGNKAEHQYAPLLPPGAGVAEENQLLADLAMRLGGTTDHLEIFHLSGIAMTPDRLHVLFFDGFAKLVPAVTVEQAETTVEEATTSRAPRSAAATRARGRASDTKDVDDTLSTLSFSACQITSAGLVVLLTGAAFLAAQGLNAVRTLDLSYNSLSSSSLYSLTQLLRFTFVKRLSLRGNALASVDVIPFREFLLEGCERQIEELDLSYTALTAAQVGVLIEALPRLHRLRVLLLEEVVVPASKWPSLVRAVERTKLCHMRVLPSATLTTSVTTLATYARAIEEVCARNARCSAETTAVSAAASAAGFFGLQTASFFEAFFYFSQLQGNRLGDEASALPKGYGAFTSNDPSLPP